MLKKITFIVLLNLVVTILFSRPRSGSYIIEGTLFSLDGKTMKSQKIIYGNETIFTNNEGVFKIKVPWIYDDCEGYKKKKCNDLLNGSHIQLIVEGVRLYIKNKWIKYGIREKKSKVYKVKVYVPLIYRKE